VIACENARSGAFRASTRHVCCPRAVAAGALSSSSSAPALTSAVLRQNRDWPCHRPVRRCTFASDRRRAAWRGGPLSPRGGRPAAPSTPPDVLAAVHPALSEPRGLRTDGPEADFHLLVLGRLRIHAYRVQMVRRTAPAATPRGPRGLSGTGRSCGMLDLRSRMPPGARGQGF